jgi:hypothetical protein
MQARKTASTDDQDHSPVCLTLDVVSLIEERVICIRIDAMRVPGKYRHIAAACSSHALLLAMSWASTYSLDKLYGSSYNESAESSCRRTKLTGRIG